jgi:ABC-type sugar transport system, permease component
MFSKAANAVANLLIGILALTCVLPMILVVIVSLTSAKALSANGFSFFPAEWSAKAYEYVFGSGGMLLRAYGVSIAITLIGTAISLLVMGLYAYAIHRTDFRGRKFFSFFCFFTMLFNGGMVPTYMVVANVLGLKNTIWALILPLVANAWYVLILRTFYSQSIHPSLIESAKIDGAGEFSIYFKIVLPQALPGLATVALFTVIAYWNDWFQALLYIDNDSMRPLQSMLMRIQDDLQFMANNIASLQGSVAMEILRDMPQESVRMAMVVLAAGPILLAYPFFQRFFVKGLTVGSIKG